MPAKNVMPFTVYLPPQIKSGLEEIAERNFRSAAAEARLAITKHVETERK